MFGELGASALDGRVVQHLLALLTKNCITSIDIMSYPGHIPNPRPTLHQTFA